MTSGIYKRTKENIKNLSLSHVGKPNGFKGKKQTDSARKKISDARKGKRSNNWQGGISKNIYFYVARYKNRKLGNGGSHTLGEWETLKAQYNWTCPCCLKNESEIKLTEDHIIPVTKGGSDNIENIQPLCRSCNSRKSNKIIIKYKII